MRSEDDTIAQFLSLPQIGLPSSSLMVDTLSRVKILRRRMDVTEEEARLALLQTELSSIQGAIRGFDATSIQVKGWCVTVSLAIGGFAAAYRKPELLIIGLATVVGFYLVNCQFNMIQRRFLKRNDEIDAELNNVGIMQFLRGQGTLNVTGAGARAFRLPEEATSVRERVTRGFPDFYFEAKDQHVQFVSIRRILPAC